MRNKERKLQRLKGYDYSQNNYYFVTICCHNRESFFGEVLNEEMQLNSMGKILERQWLWLEEQYEFVILDEFVVMPNHFHGILIIDSDTGHGNGQARSVQEEGRNESMYVAGNGQVRSVQEEGRKESMYVAGNGQARSVQGNNEPVKSLSQLVGAFKTLSSREIHKLEKSQEGHYEPKLFKWHKSFYDRIIRNEKELNNIRNYIINNPLKWALDIENSKRAIKDFNSAYYEKIAISQDLNYS